MASKTNEILWRGPGVTVRRSPFTSLYRSDGARFFGVRVMDVRATEIDGKMFEAGSWRTLTFPRSFAVSANRTVEHAARVRTLLAQVRAQVKPH